MHFEVLGMLFRNAFETIQVCLKARRIGMPGFQHHLSVDKSQLPDRPVGSGKPSEIEGRVEVMLARELNVKNPGRVRLHSGAGKCVQSVKTLFLLGTFSRDVTLSPSVHPRLESVLAVPECKAGAEESRSGSTRPADDESQRAGNGAPRAFLRRQLVE